MATPEENLARFQEISNRGIQDKLAPEKRAVFDEAVRRGLINTNEPSFPGAGVVEPALAIASSAGLSALGGLVGGMVAATPGQPEGAGADTVKAFQGASFKPRTTEGQEGLESFSEAAKLLNVPAAGLAGIVELFRGKDLDEVSQTIADIKDKGLGVVVGDAAIEKTDSPALATLANLVSQGASDVLAGGALVGSGSKAVKAAKDSTSAALPIAAKGLTKTKDLASQVARIQTPARREIARKLKAGEIDADTARFKLADEGIVNPTEVQKILGIDMPKIKLDKKAISANKQGFDEGFLDVIKKRATTSDKKAMLKMTEIGMRGKKDPLFGSDFRPADVAGESLLKKIDEIKVINKKAGRQIGAAKDVLRNKQIPLPGIGDSFIRALDELKVKVVNGKLDFKDALVSGAGRKKAISDIFERMARNKSPDALDAHELKLFIDDVVSYGKDVRGLGGNAERALKDLRSKIKETLDSNFPKYAESNKAYSDTITVLDEIQRLAGRNTDLSSSSAGGQLATLARRLTGNAQSRSQVREALNQIDEVLNKHAGFGGLKRLQGKGGDKDPNLKILMLYADELDKVTGSAAKTAFTGGIETAIKATRSPSEFIADKAVDAARKATGVSSDNAFKAMREFLEEQVNKTQR